MIRDMVTHRARNRSCVRSMIGRVMATFEIMLLARSGSEVMLPAPAVCRDVFNTLIELEHVSEGKEVK